MWGIVIGIQAQTELAKIEYTYIPQRQSENTYSRIKIEGSLPIAMHKKGHYLLPSIQYRLHTVQLEDEVPFDNAQSVENFHTIGVTLGYTFPFGKDWRFVGKIGTRLSSNFEASGIHHRDYQYTGSLYFVRKRKGATITKPSTLVLGVRYTTPASVSLPLPIITYYQRFHPQWSFAIGTPVSHLKYYSTNKKHTFQVFAGVDRFYGNIQKPRRIVNQDNTIEEADNSSMFTAFGALGYEYYLTEHVLIYLTTGHTLFNEIRLRDQERNDIYVINDKNTLYMRSGIKFKL